ncbi:hypothetical protein CALVIDRAFT_303311 [Calocera viscosa TUFC12733]|uniref:Mediator of RNA polymerase II transcription subunit 1 n=1 Tax=Calocera viscosa (strain TUFC12733) TaxID=1330018 RepID=A0A167IF09_CALVF|nr:hypothetical protein CALVIDRAFT_303311 [Calocera viscosa TUFC12733]
MESLPSLSISIPSSLSHLPPLSAHEVSAILSSYQTLPPPLPLPLPLQHPLQQLPLLPSPPPPAQLEPPPTALQQLSRSLKSGGAEYGSDVPLSPSRRSKWALLELERIARRAEMEVFSESELPTSPVYDSQSASPFDPATPHPSSQHPSGPAHMHMHNLLLGAGDFLIDINVSFSPASPSPTLVALLTSHPANPALDRLLARHLSQFFAMLRPSAPAAAASAGASASTSASALAGKEESEAEDVNTVLIQRHLSVLENWLRELRAVQALVKSAEERGESEAEAGRWWGVVGLVAGEWEGRVREACGSGAGEGEGEHSGAGEGEGEVDGDEEADDAAGGDTEPTPLDVLCTALPLPLPYLTSPSLTFLLHLAPEAYLTLLRLPSPPAPAGAQHPHTAPPLSALREFLARPPSSLPAQTYPLANLALLPSPSPAPYPFPPDSFPPSTEQPFPTSEQHHWSLSFNPPIWVRNSALSALGQVPGEGIVGQTGDWLGAVLDPRLTPQPTYTWRTRLPNNSKKGYSITFAPSDQGAGGNVSTSLEGAVQLSRLPVRSPGELRHALEVVQGECWLAGVLRGLSGESTAGEQEEDEGGVTVDQLLAGALPPNPNVPMTLALSPYLARGSGEACFRLAVLPHLTLAVFHPSSSSSGGAGGAGAGGRLRVERQSVFPPPNSGPEQARDWEARAAEVLRRGGVGFLAEWAWEGEHALVAEYPGRRLLPEVELPPQPQIRVSMDGLGHLDHLMGMGVDMDMEHHDAQLQQQLDDAALAAGQTLGVGAGEGEGSTFDELFGGSSGDVDVDVGSGFGDMQDMELADLGDLADLPEMGMDDLGDMTGMDLGIDMNMDDLALGDMRHLGMGEVRLLGRERRAGRARRARNVTCACCARRCICSFYEQARNETGRILQMAQTTRTTASSRERSLDAE